MAPRKPTSKPKRAPSPPAAKQKRAPSPPAVKQQVRTASGRERRPTEKENYRPNPNKLSIAKKSRKPGRQNRRRRP
ncbi:hypothetical protein P692DRAFT_20882396 [Suillus brevipes Sb2]|nr:hypothetical protein P692DRAFT_20882396 [Suillus brevipes Sb2]